MLQNVYSEMRSFYLKMHQNAFVGCASAHRPKLDWGGAGKGINRGRGRDGRGEREEMQGRFYVGEGGTCPHIYLVPPDSKLTVLA